MKVIVFLAAVAMASAAVVVPSAPIAHIDGVPTVTGLQSVFPTLRAAGAWNTWNTLPITSIAGNPTVIAPGAVSPFFYSGLSNVSPLVYSSTGNVVSSAIVPKYYSENKGARHIVNY